MENAVTPTTQQLRELEWVMLNLHRARNDQDVIQKNLKNIRVNKEKRLEEWKDAWLLVDKILDSVWMDARLLNREYGYPTTSRNEDDSPPNLTLRTNTPSVRDHRSGGAESTVSRERRDEQDHPSSEADSPENNQRNIVVGRVETAKEVARAARQQYRDYFDRFEQHLDTYEADLPQYPLRDRDSVGDEFRRTVWISRLQELGHDMDEKIQKHMNTQREAMEAVSDLYYDLPMTRSEIDDLCNAQMQQGDAKMRRRVDRWRKLPQDMTDESTNKPMFPEQEDEREYIDRQEPPLKPRDSASAYPDDHPVKDLMRKILADCRNKRNQEMGFYSTPKASDGNDQGTGDIDAQGAISAPDADFENESDILHQRPTRGDSEREPEVEVEAEAVPRKIRKIQESGSRGQQSRDKDEDEGANIERRSTGSPREQIRAYQERKREQERDHLARQTTNTARSTLRKESTTSTKILRKPKDSAKDKRSIARSRAEDAVHKEIEGEHCEQNKKVYAARHLRSSSSSLKRKRGNDPAVAKKGMGKAHSINESSEEGEQAPQDRASRATNRLVHNALPRYKPLPKSRRKPTIKDVFLACAAGSAD
jgi:hypothetical protein